MNEQLTAGDSIAIAVTVEDTTTSTPAVLDAGSEAVVLSDTTDTAVVNADGSVTLTAGTNVATGKTVTISGTVGGVVAEPWTGTYDVVSVVVTPPDTFAITGTFGTETAPVVTATSAVSVPAGFSVHPETGEVLDAAGNPPPPAV